MTTDVCRRGCEEDTSNGVGPGERGQRYLSTLAFLFESCVRLSAESGTSLEVSGTLLGQSRRPRRRVIVSLVVRPEGC